MSHHKSAWIAKRVTWCFFTLIIILAVAGFTGGGYTSEREVMNGNISVTYERYSRRASIVPIRVKLSKIPRDTFRLTFSNEYLKDIKIDEILPLPVYQTTTELGHSFYFLKDRGTENAEICMYIKALKAGSYNIHLMSENSGIHLQQLILP